MGYNAPLTSRVFNPTPSVLPRREGTLPHVPYPMTRDPPPLGVHGDKAMGLGVVTTRLHTTHTVKPLTLCYRPAIPQYVIYPSLRSSA